MRLLSRAFKVEMWVLLLLSVLVPGGAVWGQSVRVTPDGGSASAVTAGTSGLSYTFTVESDVIDPGAGSMLFFNLFCRTSLGTCSLPQGSVAVFQGGSGTQVSVTYNAPSSGGTELLELQAVYDGNSNFSDWGSWSIPIQGQPYDVSVTSPQVTGDRDPGTSHSHTFTITNTGDDPNDYTLAVRKSSNISSASFAQGTGPHTLQPGTVLQATLNYTISGSALVGESSYVGVNVSHLGGSSGDVLRNFNVTGSALSLNNPVPPAYTVATNSSGHTARITLNNNTAGTFSQIQLTCVSLNTSIVGSCIATVGGSSTVALAGGSAAQVDVSFDVSNTTGQADLRVSADPDPITPEPIVFGTVSVPVQSFGISLSPPSSGQTVELGQGGTLNFTLENTGTATIDLGSMMSYSSSWSRGNTSVSAPSGSLTQGQTRTVPVSYTSTSVGSAAVSLTATLNYPQQNAPLVASAQRTVTVTAPPPPSVVVTPDGTQVSNLAAGVQHTQWFTVRNDGGSATFTLTPSCTSTSPGDVICGGATQSSVVLGQGGQTSVGVNYSLGAPGSSGTVRLSASGSGTQDEGHYSVAAVPPPPPPAGPPVVGPDGDTIVVLPQIERTDSFTVTTASQSSVTHNVILTLCEPPMVCQLSQTTLDLGGATEEERTGYVRVTYTPDTLDTPVRALEFEVSHPAAQPDTGTFYVLASDPLPVLVGEANPGLESLRSECVTIEAGPGRVQCDDFQYVHAFPAVSRLNRARNIGLVYNSATAQAKRVIGVDIVLPDSLPALSKIVARLSEPDILDAQGEPIPGPTMDLFEIEGADIQRGDTTRVTFLPSQPIAANGITPYVVRITPWFGDHEGPLTRVDGQHIGVERRSSEFGKGWWLGGYEQLTLPTVAPQFGQVQTDTLLWVGGDGSARAYTPDPGQPNRWISWTRGRRDEIVMVPPPPPPSGASGYLQLDPNEGASLAAGQHQGLTGGSKMTWAFWVNPMFWAYGRIMGLDHGPLETWWIATNGQYIQLNVQDTPGSVNRDWAWSLTPDQWQFVVIEFDGSLPNHDRIKTYINGILANHGQTALPDSIKAATTQPLEFGAIPRAELMTNKAMKGQLGEFAVVHDLLSLAEKADWQANGIDFTHPELALGYRWQGDLNDESPNQNHLGNPVNLDASDYGTTTAYPSRPVASGPATTYIRKLIGGGEVHYDASGRHIKTLDRNGNGTHFNHSAIGTSGAERLTSIELPGKNGPEPAYELDWNATTLELDAVRVVDGSSDPSGWLTFDVTTTPVSGGFQIDRIQVDPVQVPGEPYVEFGYPGPQAAMSSVTSQPRNVTSTITYESSKVVQVSSTAVGETPITLDYEPSSLRGSVIIDSLSVAADSTSVFRPLRKHEVTAVLDGPRTDLNDFTTFYTNGWGAVTQMRNALNHTTRIERDNLTYPAHITKVIHPNGREVETVYYANGLQLRTTDHGILDPQTGQPAITQYEWDTQWSRVSRITSPTGLVTRMEYDPLTGDRLRQISGDPANPDTVSFSYDLGLVENVTSAEGHTMSFTYDTRGNLASTTSPSGITTQLFKDRVGRDTLSVRPIDATDSVKVATSYDPLGRIDVSKTSNTKDGDVLWVDTDYLTGTKDTEAVRRWSEPDPNFIGQITTSWTYDGFGRVKTEIAADGNADTRVYDPAGNVTSTLTRRGHTITMQYDALGRLIQRTTPGFDVTISPIPSLVGQGYTTREFSVPSDVATFVYDDMGNLKHAENADAKVRRQYDPAGRLVSDSLFIRSYDRANAEAHSYGISYGYDLESRRTLLQRPAGFVPAPEETVSYGYHPFTGLLENVSSGPLSFGWVYDRDGRPLTATLPGGITDTRDYDPDGRLTNRTVDGGALEAIGGFPGQLILTDALTYDDQGRITDAIDSGGSSTMEYHGLGALKRSDRMSNPSSYFNNAGGTSVPLGTEIYTVDAMGFFRTTDRTGLGVDGSVSRPSVWESTYDSLTGRIERRGPVGDPTTSEFYFYDAAGNRELAQWTQPNEDLSYDHGVTSSIYGADGKLRATDRQGCSPEQDPGGGEVCGLIEYGRMTTFEEYRYDALGRRILVHAQSDRGLCPGNNCPNYIQRTVWDGDQVLLEIRRPGIESLHPEELENDHGVIDLRPHEWVCDPNADPADCFDDEPPGTPIEDLCKDLEQAVIRPPGCIQVPSGPQDFFPYGVVAYIHGGELDRPLSIYRDDHSVDRNAMRIQPIANWKGDFVTGAFFDGTAADCMASAQPSCIDIQWPGERVWHGWENKDPELVQDGPKHWMGSLVYGSADASGLLYRRNRYYDPVAGQFTQEDPIGIAGGMNLYGFADGDPVNFSDPFGLDPCEEFLDEDGRATVEWAQCKGRQYAAEDEQAKDERRAQRTQRECRAAIGNFFGSLLFDLSGASAVRSGVRLWRVGNRVGNAAAAAEGRRRVRNTLWWDVPQAAGGAGAELLVVSGSDLGALDFVPYVSTGDDAFDAVVSCPR